jgi:hypothetical protein
MWFGRDLARRFDPIQPRHANVHEDYVWQMPPGSRDGFLAVRGLRDHDQVGTAFEDQSKAGADHCLVVRD